MDDLKVTLLVVIGLVGIVFASQWMIEPLDAELVMLPTATATIAVTPRPTATITPTPGCKTTPGDSSFGYVTGAPFTTTLAPPDMAGEQLSISGIVYAADCETPLSDVLIEVWQNNANGNQPTITSTLRGKMQTDAEGRYAFSTIKPGSGNGRPAHIHYRVTYPDDSNAMGTRIFFKGDRPRSYTSEFGDDLYINPSLIISLTEVTIEAETTLFGSFDIVLPVPPMSSTISQ